MSCYKVTNAAWQPIRLILGGLGVMRAGIRYQVGIAASSLIGSFIVWTVLLSAFGVALVIFVH